MFTLRSNCLKVVRDHRLPLGRLTSDLQEEINKENFYEVVKEIEKTVECFPVGLYTRKFQVDAEDAWPGRVDCPNIRNFYDVHSKYKWARIEETITIFCDCGKFRDVRCKVKHFKDTYYEGLVSYYPVGQCQRCRCRFLWFLAYLIFLVELFLIF